MKLTKITDYGIVIMTEILRTPNDIHNTEKLSLSLNLPAPTVSKILKKFKQSQFLISSRGRMGGYTLSESGKNSTLLDIIQSLEGVIALTDCAKEKHSCCRQQLCNTKTPLQTLHLWLVKNFSNIKMIDFLNPVTLNHLENMLHSRWEKNYE